MSALNRSNGSERTPFSGTQVVRLTLEDCQQIFEVRIALEPVAVLRAGELLERGRQHYRDLCVEPNSWSGIPPIWRLLKETAVFIDPVGNFSERTGVEMTGTPLRVAAARDQSGAFEHFEMLRDGGERHLDRFGQLRHGCFAGRQPRQDGPAGRIGEGGEGGGEVIHVVLKRSVNKLIGKVCSMMMFVKR